MNEKTLKKIYKHISQVDIARHFKINQSAVAQWVHKGIPANRVVELHGLTKGKVSCHEMCPDVFPK